MWSPLTTMAPPRDLCEIWRNQCIVAPRSDGLLAPDPIVRAAGRVWPKVAPDYLSDIGMFAANPLDENAREYAKATLLDLDQSLAGQAFLNPAATGLLASRMRASSMPLNSVPIGISSDAGWNSAQCHLHGSSCQAGV